MTKIVRAKEMTYEEMLSKGQLKMLKEVCSAGDIVEGCYVMANNQSYEKGMYVRAIPLEYVGIVETDADLSTLGFTRKEGTNKWFNNKYYESI